MALETVCVTGASGFIGSWVVALLLERGYSVRAQVQHVGGEYYLSDNNNNNNCFGNEGETKNLKEWAATKAKGRLELFEADLLDGDALAAAIGNSRGVFHLASPNTLDPVPDPEGFLVEPAVLGTLNVLKASHAINVKRVVLTSSISALIPNPHLPPGTIVDETSWTDIDFCKENGAWYSLSKTLAEKAAWDFVAKTGLDLVAINPACVLGGPMLQPKMNASYALILNLIKGSREAYDHTWLGTVHVKDVALAQILLYETPSAKGRHLCSQAILPFSHFANRVVELYPQYNSPRFEENTHPNLGQCSNPSKKLNELGLEFTSSDLIIQDAVSDLQHLGFLSL